ILINYIFNELKILINYSLKTLGTPFILLPFIVIIESIRLIIHPFTLTIRLTANIIAGHVLLILLGSSGINIFNFFISVCLIRLYNIHFSPYHQFGFEAAS
ncbi:ATP6 synthase, partial [Acromyrmex charruanus]